MNNTSSIVRRETKYIACFCVILSILMQMVFILFKKWDYTVLTGNLLSLASSVANFYFMGVSVQKALDRKTDDARKFMKFSQSLRNAGMFVVVVFGVVLPYFNTVATVLPIFFPRVAISFRPMFKERGVEYN